MNDELELFEQREADPGRPADEATGFRARRRAVIQARRRRNGFILAGVLGLIVVLTGVDLARGDDGLLFGGSAAPVAGSPDPAGSGSPSAETGASGQPREESALVPPGSGTFGYATGTGKVLGTAGTVRKFRVAVEKGVDTDVDAFAAEVERTLGDRAAGSAAAGTASSGWPRRGPGSSPSTWPRPAADRRSLRRGRAAHRGLHLCRPARPGDHQPRPLAERDPGLRRPLADYRPTPSTTRSATSSATATRPAPARPARAGDAATDQRPERLHRQRLALPRRPTDASRYGGPLTAEPRAAAPHVGPVYHERHARSAACRGNEFRSKEG